ncbi:MAG: ATP-dependent Clp protease ATP-binding subunit [Clostridium sp.]|nr:ATP-dependent Clp protease ATP-binding subunit [Clostridium sp.]MDY5895206.1 ATP-dependent Clp protease ATP-binding subunit [Oscillospiraceae bacterium]
MKQVLCARCKKRPAMFFVTKVEGDKTTQEGLCIKCALEMNIGPVKQIMQSMGISEDELDDVSEQFEAMFGEDGGFEPGGAGTMPFLQNFAAMNGDNSAPQTSEEEAAPEKKKRWGKKNKGEGERKRKFLDQYCTDLTAKARAGRIDRIIGRDNEIYRAIQILCRRTKNNPCLIGEPGVGKTAIAEGLALRIAAGDVPAKLKDKEIHLLDLTALVAGTQFRGQFESRIKGLIDEVKSEGNIILFIDEVHSLVGTGDAEGSMNAANILKPSLSRGEIQIIGATTFTEYRKYIEKDAALERRLQPIRVEEPSIAQTVEMLKGVKDYYEDFHRVTVSDSLIERAVVLSERYINDRFLPDKAIDLLDEACTCANLRNKNISNYETALDELSQLEEHESELMEVDSPSESDYEEIAKVKAEILKKQQDVKELETLAADNRVTEDDLGRVIQLWTGIPASKVIESDLRRLASLEDNLKAKLIGQDEAIELVCAAIRRGRVQINPRRRPASFIFVGPTGVGKTELVKLLANELFETPETLIRLDMSEFMEKHSVSRIIGSPPGYVGYDEAGQLTEKVRRKPYSVVLFDEIEKAHPDVMNILLQILDEGKITDAQGRNVSFENTVIIMTSNAGSNRGAGALGFAKSKNEASKEKALKALSEFLRPEFIGRVDEVVVFNDLTQHDYERIAALMLGELVSPLADKGIALAWDDKATEAIARLSVDGTRGARDLRNVIRRNVEDVITTRIVNGADKPFKAVNITADGDKVICNFE